MPIPQDSEHSRETLRGGADCLIHNFQGGKMKQNRIVELITDPTKNFLASFVVGTLLFTVISDGVSTLFWELLSNWAALSNLSYTVFRAIALTALLILILVLIYATRLSDWLRGWLARLPFFKAMPIEANVKPLDRVYQGLIVAMSPKNDSPAERVINYHWNGGNAPHLEHCWVICTEKSLPFATRMVKRLAEQGVTQSTQIHYGEYFLGVRDKANQDLSLLVPDDSVDDPNYVQQLVEAIYTDAQAKGLDELEVIADYTGATKGMTAGMLLACLSPERQLQYISQINFPQMMAVRVAYRLKKV